jgi:hypothetical protein
MMDRRNPERRALTLQRLLDLLREHVHGIQAEAVRVDSLTADAAQRILKRLAIRGLVRLEERRWVPRPVLLHEATLRRTQG